MVFTLNFTIIFVNRDNYIQRAMYIELLTVASFQHTNHKCIEKGNS